jgi:hypothetical protein
MGALAPTASFSRLRGEVSMLSKFAKCIYISTAGQPYWN